MTARRRHLADRFLSLAVASVPLLWTCLPTIAGGSIAARPFPPAARRLLPLLKDNDAGTRRVVALALGRLGEPQAMRPLIQAGANDPNTAVRFAAVEGLIRLGLDGDERRIAEYRQRLVGRRIERLGMANIALRDAIQLVREYSDCSVSVNWRALQVAGVAQTTKVTIDKRNITPGEAICSLLAALPKPAVFYIDTRLRVTSEQGAIRAFEQKRRRRAWQADKRLWGMQTEAGRESARKLQRDIERLSFADIELKTALRFLHEYADVPIRADWQALSKAGIDRTTRISIDLRRTTVERALELILRDVSGAAAGADADLEWLIDGKTVLVSTRKQIARRMAARPERRK